MMNKNNFENIVSVGISRPKFTRLTEKQKAGIIIPQELKELITNYLSGFVDGDASFHITIAKDSEYKTGWRIAPTFEIHLHAKDLPLLRRIRSEFGVGNISINKDGYVTYYVKSLKDITNVIIPHFDKHPLITQKRADFQLFKLVIELMNRGEHLTVEGLQKIVSIRASMNKGLTAVLTEAFPNITPVERPLVELPETIDPEWLVGFTEGCFSCIIIKSEKYKSGSQVLLRFQITQHKRDIALLGLISKYLNCGRIQSSRDTVDFIVTKYSDISNIVIPFFEKHPLQGEKRLDFADFCKVAQLMSKKAHLTQEGLENINKIKVRMNTGRVC